MRPPVVVRALRHGRQYTERDVHVLKSTAIRGLGLTVLASSALALGLSAPSLAAPSASSAPDSSGATTPVASTKQLSLRDSRIKSSSGLARSTYARDVLFTHNDRGDSNRVFAVNNRGRTRAVLRLKGAAHRDWEDISTGPRRSLWVGDIGDDSSRRARVAVYKFTEPRKLPTHGGTKKVNSTKFTFSYPDRARDAEALLVHPRTGRVYIVSKSSTDAGIYRAPAHLSTKRVNPLKKIANAPANITAGTFSPDGKSIVLGSYTHAYTYPRSLTKTPSVVKLPQRRKGESLEINRRGSRVLLGTEGTMSPVVGIAMTTSAAPTVS